MSELILLAVGQSQGAGGPAGLIGGLAPMLIIIGIFYFLVMRPQMKRQREHQDTLSKLKKGDEVITNGGLLAKVVLAEDQILTLEIADRVRVKALRSQIAGLQKSASADDQGSDQKGKK
ncbi:MAG: preprotein translocase subunit YajC [Bradymonadia bacterium]